MQMTRHSLKRNIGTLRRLFSEIGLDVSRYSDGVIVEAILTTCPLVTDDWPSDNDLRAASEWLRRYAP